MAVIRSWVESANEGRTDFPLSNLPLGAFRHPDEGDRIGVAIGNQILDLYAAAQAGLLSGLDKRIIESCQHLWVDALMALGREASRTLRERLMELLSDESSRSRIEPLLVRQSNAEMLLPTRIGD